MLNLFHRLSLDISRTGTICKAAFICAEEACAILADISDRRRTLTVEAREEGQVRGQQQRRFEVKVVNFSLNL